jgi:hypothetical protein
MSLYALVVTAIEFLVASVDLQHRALPFLHLALSRRRAASSKVRRLPSRLQKHYSRQSAREAQTPSRAKDREVSA